MDKVFQDDKLLFLLLKQLNDKIDQIRNLNDIKCTKKNTIKSHLGPSGVCSRRKADKLLSEGRIQ